jgi:hypothetical protein
MRLIKYRFNYWSCSKLADLIRGSKKPYALTLEDWDDWKNNVKNKSKIRYYIAEKFLNKLQDFFYFPFDLYRTIEIYLYNRFVSKTNCLKTGFKPGSYYELDERILFGLFNELKNFVEIELANKIPQEDRKKHKYKGWEKRSASAGLCYLQWAMSLKYDKNFGDIKDFGKPTPQAKSAKKIFDLYNWWLSRDSRPCPMDLSGWSENHKEKSNSKKRMQSFKEMQNIEEKYEAEDEKMLINLIKIRRDLWS